MENNIIELKEEELFENENKIYEKELRLNFKYFNVFWFDPNYTHDFDYFKKSFENVRFLKANDSESIVNFFNKESSIEEWIIISPGSKSEELLSKIHEKELIKAFFIFCFKPELYKELSKKYGKIYCITKEPSILYKKIIEFNRDYLVPNFNYINNDNKNKIRYNFDLNDNNLESKNKFALQSIKREINDLNKSLEKIKNKYNIFCMKTYIYLKSENSLSEFEETIKDENVVFYKYVENMRFEEKDRIKKIIKFVKNITLISLYFSSYPYLYNLFSYQEIENMIKDDITPKDYMELYNKCVYDISNNLYDKLMKNESILNEKESLKQIQIFAILFTMFGLSRHRHKDFIEYYQIINFYRDIDFCLKFLIFYFYLIFNDKKNKFMNDLFAALNLADGRTTKIFLEYSNSSLKTLKCTLKPEDQKNLDDCLRIKDFIVVGNDNFHKKIKNIEKDILFNTIKYLSFYDISIYIKNKNLVDCRKNEIGCRITYFYYLIINVDEFYKNYNKICLISSELGITFVAILYIENENKILFNKMILKIFGVITVILVYSLEDIIKFLSKQMKFMLLDGVKEILENDPELLKFLKIPIPKINFNENCNEEDYQDGCFELGETFDANIIKNKIIRIQSDNLIDMTEIAYNLYLTYTENDALDLFFKHYSIYYGFNNIPSLVSLEISGIKRILYMYCREEVKSKKSLYYMLNYDLRTRNPSKIYRYLGLIALTNKLIENGELASFKGKVYRATKLDEKMIYKLEPGSTMVNTTFWSTSKDYNIADGFLRGQIWRNAFICCETFKNNIDIDYEHLNYFGEKEVLFLPFTEFKVEKIICEKKYDKKIFIIELTELGTKNSVNINNMQIINMNDINYMNFYNIINEQNKEKEKEKEKEGNDKEEEKNKIQANEEKKDDGINKINKDEKINIKKDLEEKEKKENNLKGEDDILKRFRSNFQLNEIDYPDEYLKNLLSVASNSFEKAMLIHLENESIKKIINKQNTKDEKKLNIMINDFRKFYQLSPKDYPDEKLKEVLKNNDGDFDKAFEDLMSYIK